MADWTCNPFTGLLKAFTEVPLHTGDPDVAIAAAEIPPWRDSDTPIYSSGAGWTQAEANAACRGEGIERWITAPLPDDGSLLASRANWPLDEEAVATREWVLFSPEQQALPGFPFARLDESTECRWVCCREAGRGTPVWVPEEFVYLQPRPGERQQFCPGLSTGLSCGLERETGGQPVVLRGLQEVLERDAVVGAWWGVYPLEEWDPAEVTARVGRECWRRFERPNLRWRFYRVASPHTDHVTLVSVAGETREGWIIAVGSACRETLEASWIKSLLEAVQGRHCVRRLYREWCERGRPAPEYPVQFLDHALFYSQRPDLLPNTVLERGLTSPRGDLGWKTREGLDDVRERLGSQRVLVRSLTPPGLRVVDEPWRVVRVLVPGLQPLHGDHRLPFLGGPLWNNRPVTDWRQIPPHPFA
jgi:ribosomal protein S12 methylthiotransferase accessory factor